jgi:epoxyqueuosine reductase
MGNRIYGCDDCLAACPWNKFARTASEAKLKAREDLKSPPLAVLLALDEQAFRHLFSGSPIKRIGRSRFLRNCLVAAGNSNDQALLPVFTPHLTDVSPLVRAMAVWALQCLLPQEEFQALRQHHLAFETDADVRAEWNPS